MKMIKTLLAIAVAAGLSACAKPETVSRAAPATGLIAAPFAEQAGRDYTVTDVQVNVSRDLRVSEANVFFPIADIVWRDDPLGDRHMQVARMLKTGMSTGAISIVGNRDVIAKVDVVRFHSVTEKARYTVGGVHSIKFKLSVIDAHTGAVIEEPRLVTADFEALGGAAAIKAEREGFGQKQRITAHMAGVIQRELGSPALLAARAAAQSDISL